MGKTRVGINDDRWFKIMQIKKLKSVFIRADFIANLMVDKSINY